MELYRFNFPTEIHFGNGARRQITDILNKRGLSSPLVITDKGFSETPTFGDFLDSFSATGNTTVYNGVHGNPDENQVLDGVQAFKENGADAVIAVGGGATLDVAKCIALLATNEGNLFDYEDGIENARTVKTPLPLQIALPTTSGTGSEVGRSAVISDQTSKKKRIVFAPELLPPIVLADPELTWSLPSFMTAATGMDAFSHNIEAFFAKGYHPMCDGIALEGLRLVKRWIAKAVLHANGDAAQEESRYHMLAASLMGAVAFQKGLGVTHSCAHAMSAVFDIHHGLANAILLPATIEFNLKGLDATFVNRIGTALEIDSPSTEKIVRFVQDLNAEIGIPGTLAGAGFSGIDLDKLVEFAIADSCHLQNPVSVTKADFKTIFEQILE
jgi:alcohol dehydrogenase class IV